jgi:serine/threonine protein kinase
MEFDKITMKFKQLNSEEVSRRLKKRNTFVGTAEYVAPEVLNDSEVGPETDLWALGCIIYHMYTGYSPFKDKTEYLVFRKILEGKMNMPKELPLEAANLIKSLLILDPLKRLGSGRQGILLLTTGFGNDFDALKVHPFFKGLNYDGLSEMALPHQNSLKIKVFFKENQVKQGKKEETQGNGISTNKGELKILKEGIVKKKSPWFHYNTRKLILYNTPKLEYLDTSKNLLKERHS